MQTFAPHLYSNGAEIHQIPPEAAIPQCTIKPLSMNKCDECLKIDLNAINVTAVPMWTFLPLNISMELKTMKFLQMLPYQSAQSHHSQ